MKFQELISALMPAAVVAILLFTAGCVAAQAPAPSPIAASDCVSQISTLTPCLSYVLTPSNDTKPASGCCTALASVVATNVSCLCLVVDPRNTQGLPVNMTRALALPGTCKVQTPPLSQCGTSLASPAGSPLVSPAASPTKSPVFVSPVVSPSISPAKTPSVSSPTPSATPSAVGITTPDSAPAPALAPTSVAPITGGSSPSPSTTSPAPTSVAPITGGSSPSPSTTSPPSPSSAGSPAAPSSPTVTPGASANPSTGGTSGTAPPASPPTENVASTFTPSMTFLTVAALTLAAVQF